MGKRSSGPLRTTPAGLSAPGGRLERKKQSAWTLPCLFALSCLGAWAPLAAGQEPQGLRPGEFIGQSTPASPANENDFETKEPFSAIYVGADVTAVVNEMLGDFLKISFSIAPDVSGAVTMRVDNLRSRLATIEALRSSLQPLGVMVTDTGSFVTITRGGNQQGPAQAAAINAGQPSPAGGGVVALTTRFIAPSQLSPLVAPFAPGGSVVLADDSRRFLLVRGDEAAINAISSAAAMFDVDWFAQVSTAALKSEHLPPHELARELKQLLGPAAALLEFVPMPRLGRLMVLARNAEALQAVEQLASDLDKPSSTQSPGLLVHQTRHASAEALAKSLKEIGGQSASGASVESLAPPDSQVRSGPANPAGTAALASSSATDTALPMTVATNLAQNIVIVRGTPAQLGEARILLEVLDKTPPQVLIEAAIVEITLNDELEFGVNWRGLEERLAATFTDVPTGAIASRFPGLSLSYVNTDIEAALNLLASVTKVEVMSRPSLVALNNEVAELQVGDQVPIVTQTAISVTDPDAPIVNSTTYRDTGVILKVTPSVRAAGVVELQIAQEVSQVARTTSSGIDSPTIQQRRLESRLLVPSGEAVALGGLFSVTRTRAVTGIPLLKDLPLLGKLFRSESNLVERTELLVFLTPRVLHDTQSATDVTAELRKSFARLEAELAPR